MHALKAVASIPSLSAATEKIQANLFMRSARRRGRQSNKLSTVLGLLCLLAPFDAGAKANQALERERQTHVEVRLRY